MATDPTNLVEGDDTSETDTAASDTGVEQQEVTETEQQFDDDGNPIEEPEEDEEVDLDDIKLKVPKAAAAKLKELKEGSLRQADYTKKTQVLADDRKAFEAARQSFAETTDAELGAVTQMTALDQQIAPYAKLSQADWNAWEDQDPFEAQKGWRNFQFLQNARNNAVGQFHHLRNERISKAQQDAARRVEEGRQTLSKDIPEWNDDHKAKLIGFAAEFGFSREELNDLEEDPRVARVLHAAFTGSQAKRQQQQAQRHVTAQQAQPAAKAGGSGAPPIGLDDRLSQAEWIKRREAQVRKARG